MKLSNIACKNAKTEEKPRKLSDGGGLYLLVNPSGSKYWRMKYRFLGKEKLLSIGTYPIISLSEARVARDEAKKLLVNGVDPSSHKKKQKKERIRNSQNTFQAVAMEWHETKKSGWTDNYAKGILTRLEKDVFPFIGTTPIAKIETSDLLDVLRKIEARGALDIAGRIRQLCGQVFSFGITTGRCERNLAVDLVGALKPHKTKHFPALQTSEIPELLQALEKNEARLYARTRRAIKLSMLTFVRPGELRAAQWDEFNLAEKEWRIPAHRMKMNREHIVPLSEQAIKILKEQKDETGYLKTPFVFPSIIKPRKPISDGTVNVALKKLGFHGRMTAHGFRALARTAIREKLKYDPDVIEVQLAHKASGALGEAYNRAQFLDERKVMMQDWADYLDGVKN